MVVVLHEMARVRIFSPKTKNGMGKVIASFEQLTDDLCISADLASVVRTFLFSLCRHTLGYMPMAKRATNMSNLGSGPGKKKKNVTKIYRLRTIPLFLKYYR